MSNHKLRRIDIDKKNETRTQEISEMIGEGGLGAYKYYDYPKTTSVNKSDDASDMIDEGGTSSRLNFNEETIPNFKD